MKQLHKKMNPEGERSSSGSRGKDSRGEASREEGSGSKGGAEYS